jgi:hypothetical protein
VNNEKVKKVMGEINCINSKMGEVNAMGKDENQEEMWLTIDSGASENVIGRDCARRFPVKPSAGSIAGVQYMAANGEVMRNEGEKEVKVVTKEGSRCTLKMQVTNVTKPLMSVSRICDAGHRVVFEDKGGYIEHLATKQKTSFQRIDNVYRLKVQVPFARPVM